MGINYKPLWKLLIDKETTKSELIEKIGIAPSTFSKMTRNEYVSMDILVRIFSVLRCQLSDIVEVELGSTSKGKWELMKRKLKKRCKMLRNSINHNEKVKSNELNQKS